MRETLRKAADTGPWTRNIPKSKVEKIRMLRDEIAVLRAKGWKWEEVALALAPQLDASANTIRLAIREPKKKTVYEASRNRKKTNVRAVAKRASGESER